MVKCVLKVVGQETKEACRTYQLYKGMYTGIGGSIHLIHLLWEQHTHKDDWGLLLIETHNAFNEYNCKEILWTL